MTSMTIEDISVAERLRAGVITPLVMPASRPKHVWTPPPGRQATPDPDPDGVALLRALFADWNQSTASPGNARMRRLRRRNGTGWHA